MKQPDTTRFSPKPELVHMENIPAIHKSGNSPTLERVDPPLRTREARPGTSIPNEEVQTSVRADERTTVRRSTKRYAFEFFSDQILKLKKRALMAQLAGKDLSMSEIVRNAVDGYLANDRTDER